MLIIIQTAEKVKRKIKYFPVIFYAVLCTVLTFGQSVVARYSITLRLQRSFSAPRANARYRGRSCTLSQQKYSAPFGTLYFWLGMSDSNARMTESETVALPLGESPLCRDFALFYGVILTNFSRFGKHFYILLGSFFFFRQKLPANDFFPPTQSFIIV